MTRINVIDPALLNPDHLGAEYRELPRVFGNVRKLIEKGIQPHQIKQIPTYRLGKGHLTFFYPRLAYLVRRYQQICDVCRYRGRAVNYGNIDTLVEGIDACWFGEWEPDEKAIQLNLSRIVERGGLVQPELQFRWLIRDIPRDFM